jgi:hypothetical protein
MNRHRHSRCHYKRNSGSTPAGMNNLHIGEPAGRQAPGGLPATSAAAAMVPGRTLPLYGSRSRPHSRDENQTLKPKSQRSVRGWRWRSHRRRSFLQLPPPQRWRRRPPAHQHRTSGRRPPKAHWQVLTPVLATKTRMGPPQNTSTALAAYDVL